MSQNHQAKEVMCTMCNVPSIEYILRKRSINKISHVVKLFLRVLTIVWIDGLSSGPKKMQQVLEQNQTNIKELPA